VLTKLHSKPPAIMRWIRILTALAELDVGRVCETASNEERGLYAA
jgi:hypothetical protein